MPKSSSGGQYKGEAAAAAATASAAMLLGRLSIMWLLLLLAAASAGAASTAATARTAQLSCDAVRPYFEALGFPAGGIPAKPVSSRELKVCGGLASNAGEACCSADMEERLQARARDKHDQKTQDTLQRLQKVLQSRADKFHEFFNDLLKSSKKSFHEMFKKTYGILYEQNAYVFIDLFRELEKYYAKGSIDLDDVMDTFFNTLYQKMFTVLNSQYKFDEKYLDCVSQHMKDMRPFGDVPQKLGVQIKRSFVATRAFSQALQVAADVLRNMQQLKASNECAAGLTRMTACPYCSGVPGVVLACNDLCENVMKGCLAQHAALDADWNKFVEAVDKVAERLLGPFNIEMLVRPINLKISEAIMNFQESSSDVTQRVFKGCGRPVLGRRRRAAARDGKEIDEHKPLRFDEEPGQRDDEDAEEEEDEEHQSSAAILDKLVKEIKQRIRDSRQFWLYLPYKLCGDGLVVPPSNTNDCWNGTHVDKYIYPASSNGESQSLNPEVRVSGPRVAIVREQIYALSSISTRLRTAFNGHDVDWIDIEESWTSGSGSGSSATDDEDDDDDDDEKEEDAGGRGGFPENEDDEREGSGGGFVETKVTSKAPPVLSSTPKPRIEEEEEVVEEEEEEEEEESASVPMPKPPTRIDVIQQNPEDSGPSTDDLDVNTRDSNSHDKDTLVPVDRGAAFSWKARTLTVCLLPMVVVMLSSGDRLTEYL